MPVVGDWVALDVAGSIVDVMPRRTTISRRAAHEPASGVSREQVIAANVDLVLVVQALGQELDRRLLERYLALALESGARPAVVLTKADLENDPAAVAAEIADIGGAVPIYLLSARTGLGLDAIRAALGPGTTGVLLGPSGVGKSTLVNALIDDESRLATAAVAPDGSGRHTTTRRELVLLPSGGVIVDNPGMREVHLWIGDRDLTDAFDDIAELALACRFTDCSHETEPGCAVRAALASGELSRERWESYQALERELAELAERLERRERSRSRRRPARRELDSARVEALQRESRRYVVGGDQPGACPRRRRARRASACGTARSRAGASSSRAPPPGQQAPDPAREHRSYPFWARVTAAMWVLVLGILIGGAAIPHAQDRPRVVPKNEDARFCKTPPRPAGRADAARRLLTRQHGRGTLRARNDVADRGYNRAFPGL